MASFCPVAGATMPGSDWPDSAFIVVPSDLGLGVGGIVLYCCI